MFSSTQRAFLSKYLGYEEPADAAKERVLSEIDLSDGNPADIWIAAKSEADAELAKLQSAIAGINDPDLERIHDFGLSGATDGNNAALMVALLRYNMARGDDRAKAAKKVVEQAESFRSFLASDPIIKLCEDNPFNAAVNISGPLDRALAQISVRVSA